MTLFWFYIIVEVTLVFHFKAHNNCSGNAGFKFNYLKRKQKTEVKRKVRKDSKIILQHNTYITTKNFQPILELRSFARYNPSLWQPFYVKSQQKIRNSFKTKPFTVPYARSFTINWATLNTHWFSRSNFPLYLSIIWVGLFIVTSTPLSPLQTPQKNSKKFHKKQYFYSLENVFWEINLNIRWNF